MKTKLTAGDRIIDKRFFSMAGLAMRAGKCLSGADSVERALKKGRARVVLVDSLISEGSLKAVRDACVYRGVRLLEADPPGELARSLGRSAGRVFAITDEGFANRLIELYDESDIRLSEV